MGVKLYGLYRAAALKVRTLASGMQRNDDEDAENQLYTLVSHVQVTNSDGKEINPKGLQTEVVNE